MKKIICDVCRKEFFSKLNRKRCSTICSIKIAKIKNKIRKNYNNSGYCKLRFEIFKRDNFTCQYCGRNIKKDGIRLYCDHIKPISKGGKTSHNNLITSCFECNIGKRDILLSERMLKKR